MRGQAHTLEAVIGAMLLVTSLTFALQVTAVTPLSSSTSSQHLENQQEATAAGVLAVAAEQGVLKPASTYGNDTADGRDDARFSFHHPDENGFYVNAAPTNRFGAMLDRAFGTRGLAYNVYVVYQTTSNTTNSVRMVYRGQPSDNAVVARRTVTLYDHDALHEPEADGDATDFDIAQPTATVLAGAGDDFYAQDVAAGPVFNVVQVEVMVWRQ